MRTIIYPYKMGSKSAKHLARNLGAIRVYPDRKYRPRPSDFIINWGNSQKASWGFRGTNLFNYPGYVAIAANKLDTFQRFESTSVPCPVWGTHKTLAESWIRDGHKVYCRTSLTGHSGSGIVLASTEEELVNAPLYTQYTNAKYEYRVHVVNNEIIDFQRKKKRNGVEADMYIKNHQNGWIFAREDVTLPEKVQEAALNAVRALGLDFGAMDIGYHVLNDEAFIYEVNTAPGLEGTTLVKYTEAFERMREWQ